jgi:glyoxylase-like metal-dependent hydrolase (beta-lactamase superfamily II)
MAVKSLQVLFMGFQDGTDKGFMTFGIDIGKKMISPFMCFLIKADEGNILVDAGLHPEDVALMARTAPITMPEEKQLPQQLKSVGLSMEDINTVIMTHMHPDHAGWLNQLTKAEVVIQREEHYMAFDPMPYTKYFRNRYNSPNIKWKLIDGDHVLMPGITLLLTPGHTAGGQTVMVDLPKSGTILLVGDAGFLLENFEKERIPTSFHDPKEALLSIKRINTWARVRNARIFPTHDFEYYSKVMLKSPEVYD